MSAPASEASAWSLSGVWRRLWRRKSARPESRAVLIPLAGRAGSGAVGAVEAVNGGTEYTIAPDTDPMLVELIDANLYESGLEARDAVRRLPHTRRALRLLSSSGGMRLRAVSAKPFQNLAPVNARSAELGLALALLMLERRSPFVVAAATGTLEEPQGGALGGDRRIGPVGGLAEKFAALGDHLRRHKGGAWGRELRLLIPLSTLQGEPLELAHAVELARLSAEAQAVGVALSVWPVERLSEAALVVKAVERRKHPLEDLARLGLLAGAMLLVGAIQIGAWALTLPDMEFARLPLGDMGSVPSPARSVSVYDPARKGYEVLPHCRGPDDAPHVRVKEEGLTLVVTTRAGSAPVWAHEFLVVVVGEERLGAGHSLKLYPMETLPVESRPRKLEDGSIIWGMRLLVEAPAEEMKIFVLGRKLLPFDSVKIEQGLAARMEAPESEGRRINAAANYLRGMGARRLDYSLHGVENLEDCTLMEGF